MKSIWLGITAMLVTCVFVPCIKAQSDADSTRTPGDDFSLQGALQMFKQANSLEEFEKLINTQDNHVNNLDLNGDGDIDYVRVTDTMDKGVHALVLQVPVSEKESQDLAIIELEKTGENNAEVQIIGDEDIYGEQTIVEPDGGENGDEESDDDGKGYSDLNENYHASRIVVNVWTWPVVQFMYAPAYRVWVSPWRWRVYPAWWHPWRPLAWRAFHPFRLRYRPGFAVVRTNRIMGAHRLYAPVRTTSGIVRNRHQASIRHYRVTRTTTIKGKAGRTRIKTTRTGRGRRGR